VSPPSAEQEHDDRARRLERATALVYSQRVPDGDRGRRVTVSVEEGKAAVRARFDAFNAADWERFKDLIAPEATIHFPGAPGPMTRDGWVGICLTMDPKPPAIQISVDDQIGEGDTVVTRWTIRGQAAAFHGVSIDRVVNGRVVEHREFFEQAAR
jgi:hypothetical protein